MTLTQTELSPLAIFLPGASKLTPQHLERLAYVYVRQSSPKQVARNLESQALQYQLVQRATALGWSSQRIRVIDADQGLSGKESTYRNGFKELVAEVSLGHVGIIFGTEVSRLARNNSDWYQLLDIAAILSTLIADNDGIYDPASYNDRLLLGLKGSLSEAELHLLRQRLDAGRLNQVKRGVYRQMLPTGLSRLSDGTVVKDPDDQIRDTLELVFRRFSELGSCRQVAKSLRQSGVLLPRRQTGGFLGGQLLWKEASVDAIYGIIQNPAYAGAFVYGRRPSDPVRRQITGRAIQTRKAMEEWATIRQGVYPAYLSWEEFLRNQQRLHTNAATFERQSGRAQGAVRQGGALLQGLLVCDQCGHFMHVGYKPAIVYFCGAQQKRLQSPSCTFLSHQASAELEKLVVESFFEALRPAQLDVLQGILAAQQAEHQNLLQIWQERVKRASYAVQLAQRQYDAVDPANRLVAAELERRWEAALAQLHQTQQEYHRFEASAQLAAIPEEMAERFRQISQTLPQLWSGGELSNPEKKELLRCLIAQVIVHWSSSDTIEVRVVWLSGYYSVLELRPPVHKLRDLTDYQEMSERVATLWGEGLGEREIAKQMTKEGYRSSHMPYVSTVTVRNIRLEYLKANPARVSLQAPSLPGALAVAEFAERYGFEQIWLYRQIENQRLGAEYLSRHPRHRTYLIKEVPELVEKLRVLWERKEGWKKRHEQHQEVVK